MKKFKIKNLQVGEGSVVGKPANPECKIVLWKSAEDVTKPETKPQDETTVLERFWNWLKKEESQGHPCQCETQGCGEPVAKSGEDMPNTVEIEKALAEKDAEIAALRVQVEKAATEQKKIENEKREKSIIEKASKIQIPGIDSKLVLALVKSAEGTPAEAPAAEVLAAVQTSTAALMQHASTETGSQSAPASQGKQEILEGKAAALLAANPQITREQAISQALKTNPELYE